MKMSQLSNLLEGSVDLQACYEVHQMVEPNEGRLSSQLPSAAAGAQGCEGAEHRSKMDAPSL
jgi:hypothetical protein